MIIESDDFKFRECDACRGKPGSPQLCKPCLHNRAAINRMNEYIRWRGRSLRERVAWWIYEIYISLTWGVPK